VADPVPAEPRPVTFFVPKWCPPSLNPFIGVHWRKLDQLKRQLADLLGVYAMLAGVRRVDHAFRPVRHVRLHVIGWKGLTLPDPDNVLKLFLDSARRCGLIVDDKDEWCKWEPPVLVRGAPDLTTVTLTDLELRPPCAPEDDPYTRSLLGALTRRANQNRKRNPSRDEAKTPPARRPPPGAGADGRIP
jgi:hypothetical protein